MAGHTHYKSCTNGKNICMGIARGEAERIATPINHYVGKVMDCFSIGMKEKTKHKLPNQLSTPWLLRPT
jgi:hypothetical protein